MFVHDITMCSCPCFLIILIIFVRVCMCLKILECISIIDLFHGALIFFFCFSFLALKNNSMHFQIGTSNREGPIKSVTNHFNRLHQNDISKSLIAAENDAYKNVILICLL